MDTDIIEWPDDEGVGSLSARVELLLKENERLREALQKIVDYDWSWEGGGKLGKIEGFCAKIARSALQQKDSE